MIHEVQLDLYDRKILRKLAEDGRITWRELAETIGLSLTPTLRRVRMLEASGMISGYHAHLDEERLAGSMTVFISVTLERQVRDVLENFEDHVAKLPEVMSGFLMTGGSDYLLRAVVRNLAHYRDLLNNLTIVEGVAHIQSSFALKAFVNKPSPLMD
ncbi:Lrp/AsnC family transcriptional regulator [Sphingorhabdus sp.]|uniref:Lrp/AsnC family transcriptional regulator n=1 Tax=Sphingorhabdus sp. TaxID=1902408 RepID=UPI0038FCC135